MGRGEAIAAPSLTPHMCGRYTLATPETWIRDEFGLAELPPDYRPRYNITPTQAVLAIIRAEDGRRAGWLRWGLIPFWAKDPAIGNRMINARAETVHEKPAFRAAFQSRRCLIVADGYYEWQALPGGRKAPVWLHRTDRRPFAMAGLWERWTPPEAGDPLYTCTIITTAANDFVRPVHERMTAILSREEATLWLDPAADRESLRALLRPYQHHDLAAHQVSTLVNSPKNDRPECIEPV